uniref:UBX domain-containing protein n=1 Tax=Clastoptera arizonana TaxID=38151 RepID=A0A1B6C6X3_9HEMI
MDNHDMGLTQDQTDKVLQLQDLTGIDNMAVCRDVLQRHNWDLEAAVQDQLNIREGRPTVFASEHAPPMVVTDAISQHVFISPPSQNLNRWGGTIGYIVSFVFHICYDTLSSIFRITYRWFWYNPRRQVTNPVGDVMNFINYFNATFGNRHPVFYQGSYSQVLNDAKQELKFLLVYLHKDNNTDCNNFCRTILGNPAVIDYINTNMLFWACSISSGEGFRVSQALRESSYPFLGLIVLKESRMTIVFRQEGPVEPAQLIRRLQSVIEKNEASIIAARADRMERSFNQSLRLQQDEAYMQSLIADQEKERLRCQELQRLEGEEEKKRQLEIEEQERKQKILEEKEATLERVPSEPPSDHPQTVRLLFKMPDGSRLERRFLNSHQIKDVYNFIFCYPGSPDKFEIATNFPKRTLDCEGDKKFITLKDAGLNKGEVLFIYDLES